jgi:hypothetical protein
MTAFMTPVRERITWIRPNPNRPGHTLISHPWQWIVREPDGYERLFNTKREALEWIDSYGK